MISLYDILEAANGQLFGEPGAELFTGFSFDPQYTTDSSLYVALRTDQGDGHSEIKQAVARGATGILCMRPPEFDTEGLSVILVKDTQTAVMRWSSMVLKKLGIQVIAVTGSAGRATTVEAISRVLETRFPVLRSDGAANGRLNLPMTAAKLRPEHRFMVLEFCANQPGEMSEIVLSAQPHVGVVLHTSEIHNEYFDSSDQFIAEIDLLIEYLPTTGLAVLNYEDDRTRAMATHTRARSMTIGVDSFGADLMAHNLVIGLGGTGFDVRSTVERLVGRWTPLLGKHQLYSILAAVAVGTHYEIPLDDALRALTTMESMPGQMSPLNGVHGSFLIDETFDTAPYALSAALDWLKTARAHKQRSILVFGDMDNLGHYSQREHRVVGQHAAEIVDMFVTVGSDAAYAGRAALDQGMDADKVFITHSIQDAIAQLRYVGRINDGDLIVIAGGAQARMELLIRELLVEIKDLGRLARQNQVLETDTVLRPMRAHWVDIDLDALAHNVRGIKNLIGSKVTLFAVVKADAYGHGAVAVARTALLNGAEAMAVASIHEALQLRDAGIEAPVLVMSYTPVQAARQAVRQNITLTLYDIDMARGYDRVAREAGGTLRVHVKVDTGMGRLGVLAINAVSFFRQLMNLSNLEIEGIYTHFSTADEDLGIMQEQLNRFKQVLAPLRAAGVTFRYIHAANSAGTLVSNETHFNAVRVGLALYGLSPSDIVPVPHDFQSVLTWKTVIAQVKTLPAGHPVGYGNTYVTEAETRTAVIPVGYADGLRRSPGYWGYVLVRGQSAPIIGRVSMEKTILDVTNIPGVAIGDEVVLIGQQGTQLITADDIARRIGTISYEIVTTIAARHPR